MSSSATRIRAAYGAACACAALAACAPESSEVVRLAPLASTAPNSSGTAQGSVRFGRFSGDGLVLASGESIRVELDSASDRSPARLLFGTGALELAESPSPAIVRFTVRADGSEIFAQEAAAAPSAKFAWHEVELDGRPRSIEFSLSGPAARGAFLAPRLAPRGVSIESQERPGIIVFLADTFRADVLSAYGGTHVTTPHLDAWSEQGVLFRDARSVSSWTLPAHASLMSGLYPAQHGAFEKDRRLPASIQTLAEHMAANGYRTGAVTDSLFVSEAFGLDQGFESFEEFPKVDLPRTLAAVRDFLAQDDGRPLFLFVQTYRTHAPYRVSPKTAVTHAESLGLKRVFERYMDGREEYAANLADYPEDLRATYLGTTVDLDLGFRRFLELVDESGQSREPFVVFTSDHGESFNEHGALGHGGVPWEEIARVPLVLVGPGLDARVDHGAASIVDLPRTIADLAGLPPVPAWGGTSLLSDEREPADYAFVRIQDRWLAAGVQADRKVYIPVDQLDTGNARFAFHLGLDAEEQDNVAEQEPWVQEVVDDLTPAFERFVEPLVDPEDVVLDGELRARLQTMGYSE